MHYNSLPAGHRMADRFQLEGMIGCGASSTVYRAFDSEAQNRVALKVLDPFLAQDPFDLDKFGREIQIIRRLDHPNIVRLESCFCDAEFYVITMEYLDAVDLGASLGRDGPFEVGPFLAAAKSITDAVGSCHKVGVVHHALKPSNVLVSSTGSIKLMDFGISKINTMPDLTKIGTVIRSPVYMAPEQFTSKTSDPRSDLYSLGVMFYELLSGRPPYDGISPAAILQQQAEKPVAPLSSLRDDIPEWLVAIVMKCLAINRIRRYQSAYELLRDLEKAGQSLARHEASRPVEACHQCQAERIVGLAFCHDCGSLVKPGVARRRHALVLYQCDDPDALSHRLSEFYPRSDSSAIREKLDPLPALVVWKVSRETASAVADHLRNIPCELAISDKLIQEMRLPKRYVLLGCFAFLPVLIYQERLTISGALAMILISQLLMVWFYRRRMRPLISLGQPGMRGEAGVDPLVAPMARHFRKLRGRDLKWLLGRIVRGYLALRAASKSTTVAAFDTKQISRLVDRAMSAARTIDGYEIYLESHNQNGFKRKIEAAETKLRLAKSPERIESLVGVKAYLRSEADRYVELREFRSRLFSGLLNLNAVLRALSDAVFELRKAPQVSAELEDLENALSVEAAPAVPKV